MTEDDNWETVKTKEQRLRELKQSKAAKATKVKESSSADEQDYGVPAERAPFPPGQKYNTTLVHVEDNGNVVEREVTLQDSEWEVS